MRFMKTIAASAVLAFATAGTAMAHSPDKIFVSVTSDNVLSQGMAMVLATQSMKQGQEPRVLLCGDAAEMATTSYDMPALQPFGASPQQLMQNLINEGVTVEVCAIFLPNTDFTEDDLIEGVGIAKPDDVSKYMADKNVRYFSH